MYKNDITAINEAYNSINRKVYSVQINVPYEGSISLGIFSSRQNAEQRVRDYRDTAKTNENLNYDISVYEINLDEPVYKWDDEYTPISTWKAPSGSDDKNEK